MWFLIFLFLFAQKVQAVPVPPMNICQITANVVKLNTNGNLSIKIIESTLKEKSSFDNKNCENYVGETINVGVSDLIWFTSFLVDREIKAFLTYSGDEFGAGYYIKPIITPSDTPEPAITNIPVPTPTINPAIVLFIQYKNDYLFNRDQYQVAYLDYTQKKQIHTKYNTITTQKDQIEATKQASITRNNTLKNYMRALRVLLDVYKDTDSTNTAKLQIELTKLESWLDEQNSIVSTLNNPTDLSSNASDFKSKYLFVQKIIYSALVQHEYNLRLSTLNQLKTTISDLLTDPTINADGKSWLNTLIIKADNSLTNLTGALATTTQNQTNSRVFNNFYPDAQELFIKSNQYNQEIINDIKNILTKFTINP